MCKYCQEEKIRSLKYSKINPNEYINKRYGNVTITDCYWIKEKRYRLYVDYKCDCGNVKSCTLDHLKSGRIKSCGCLKNITMVKRNTKHNLYKEHKRIFDVWNNMIQRCYNKKNPNYKKSGGSSNINPNKNNPNKNNSSSNNKNKTKNSLQGKNKRYSGRQCVGRKIKE